MSWEQPRSLWSGQQALPSSEERSSATAIMAGGKLTWHQANHLVLNAVRGSSHLEPVNQVNST